MRKNFKKFMSMLLCIAMLSTVLATAKATEATSEFDFSSSDALNVYDTFEKTVLPNGISYVETIKLNRIDTRNQLPIDAYRYGSFLRNSDESQYFSVFNLPYGGAIVSNVLTVYADPEVQFNIVDSNGNFIANSNLINYDKSKISYFKRSDENGHKVYYMEFIPGQAEEGTLMIEFSTESKTVQPHYSFWFGHPLTRTQTYNAGTNTWLMLLKPQTSTPAGQELGFYYNRGAPRAWVTDVNITRTAQKDQAYLNGPVNFTVLVPGMTRNSVTQATNTNTAHFSFSVNSSSAYSAYGNYNFRVSSGKWGTIFTGPALYQYDGNVTVDYLYAFGY